MSKGCGYVDGLGRECQLPGPHYGDRHIFRAMDGQNCGEVSDYGEVCARPCGHFGMHLTEADENGSIGWPQIRLRVVPRDR